MKDQKMKIYTKTGDLGKTSLLGGKRVAKSNAQIECYGEVDHLNTLVGTLVCAINDAPIEVELKFLTEIQRDLFSIGGLLACESEKRQTFELISLNEDDIVKIEKEIDALENEVSVLNNFILPGGSMSACFAHQCRAYTRKVERLLVRSSESDESYQRIIVYFNRLSDYFFVFSRYLNKQESVDEIIWKGK